MVSIIEIEEYLFSHPDSRLNDILFDFKEMPFPQITDTDILPVLRELERDRYIMRERIGKPTSKKKDGKPRNQKVYIYRLTEKALRVRKAYGTFFNTPVAERIKKNREREWAPDGKYFVNPGPGPRFV